MSTRNSTRKEEMKKIGRALTGGNQGRDRDGHNGRRSSQGGKNTDGHQSGGATATGSSQASTYTSGGGNSSRGGYQLQRGAGGNQGTRRGGGSDRPRDQECTAAGQDMPPHMKSTVASQSRQVKIDVTTTKKPDASAPKMTGKAELDLYKAEYRKLKSENEDMRANLDDFTNTLEVKDAEIDKLNRFLGKKAAEFGDLEENYKQTQEDFKASQTESAQLKDSVNKLTAEVETKDAQVVKLARDVNNFEELFKQAQQRNIEVDNEFRKVTESSVKLQEKVKRYKEYYGNMTKDLEQLREENKQLLQAQDKEIAAREDAEQKLARVKSDLAKAQSESEDKQYYIVETENEDIKKMRELSSELDKMTKEMEDSKEALEKKHIENLQIKSEYQQLGDKMKNQVIEYEEKLKAKAEDAEKSINWSHVKAMESEQLQKQLNNTIDDLKAETKAIKKENEDTKLSLQKEREQCLKLVNEVRKLQESNKQMEGVVNNKEAELTKMQEVISKLEETETSKLELQKKYEEILLQTSNSEEVQEEKDEIVKQLESTVKEKDVTINNMKSDMNKMEQELKELKENIPSAVEKDKENLLQENDDPAGLDGKLQQIIEEKASLEKQMQAGYKEREDRIAELEEFINDQVTELDKMEAAMKQTVANKEIAEKELNEALEKKQAELTALQVAYEEKENEISWSVSPVYDDKQESSHVRSEVSQAEEKLAEANQQLLAYKEEIQKLKEGGLAKQETTTNKGSVDADGLLETTKRLTREVAMLRKQNLELKEQKESLSKRCDSYRSSSEVLREMMKKQPGTEMQTKVATKINELNQQVTHLQEENEKLHSLTTGAANKPSHESDEEFRSSVEYQKDVDQPAQLLKKLRELESELESTRSTLEDERKKHKEKLKELKAQASHQQSTNQSVTIGKTSRDHSPDDMDQLLKENEGHKQTQKQLYESYQKLKDRYRQKEEEVSKLETHCSQLRAEFEKQRDDLSKAKEELERAPGLNKFVQEQHEKLVMAERDRDTATAMMDQKESEQKTEIELNATIVQMRSNHSLLIKSKEDEIEKLTRAIDSKEIEIAELAADKKDLEEKLARKRSKVSTTQATTFDSNQGVEVLQGCSRESTHPSSNNSALTTVASENLLVTLREREQTIEKLNKKVEQLQKQQVKSSDDSGVGGPCVEHTQSGGVGESPNEGNRNADDSYTKKLQSTIGDLTKKLTVERGATEDAKSQLSQSQSKVNELTEELAVERSVTDNAKNEMDKLMGQLQQLNNDKKAGYKEREDRIAALEEFINDQVTELDKMEAAMKQTVANKQLLEKDYQKLNEYYDLAKKMVEDYQNRLTAQEDTISAIRRTEENATNAIATLEQEKELLIQSNQKMSREVARLMSVDIELQSSKKEVEKCQLELRKAEEELQTKEFMLNTYKEDFEAERKDRENAHNIKEDEITKARIEKEQFEAKCQEKVQNIKQALETQMNTLKEQVNYHAKENDRLKKECGRLHTELDKERKDAQGKSDVYKKKTEQFQLQWRKREEAEARITTLTEQLNAQCELNKQLNSTIDSMMRKSKGIDPQIPPNNMASQQSQQRRVSPNNPPYSNMSIPMDTSSDQYHTPSTMSKPSPYDPSTYTNAGMGFQQQPPPLSTSQQAWQRQRHQEQQHFYKMPPQQQQEQLHLRGQGRGPSHNQPVKPLHEGTHYPPDYQGQRKNFLPPVNVDNYQPRSIQPLPTQVNPDQYNVAGTNAAPMQRQFPHDDYNYGRNSGPASLDSSLTKSRSAAGYTNHPPPDQSPLTAAKRPAEKPTQYASEGINEEIRYQADKQRRHQEYERFDSTLQLDPYLICPKCKLQFREGQLPEYRHHIDNCNQ